MLYGFFVLGYFAFLRSFAFFGYFALWVEQQAKFLSKKMMSIRRESRENKGKEVDQVTYWPTKGVHQEESIKVLFITIKISVIFY